jgi:hypothetical protein
VIFCPVLKWPLLRILFEGLEKQRDELRQRVKEANIDDASIVPDVVKDISGDIRNFSTRLTSFTGIFDQILALASKSALSADKLVKAGQRE